MLQRLVVSVLAFAALLSGATPVVAQSVGLGPRMSFVSADSHSGTAASRFLGGTLRMQSSKHVIFEAALDYRTQTSLDGKARMRERPLQGSLLLFPVRKAFAPYLLGGFGVYSQTFESLDLLGKVASTTTDRKTGAHIGLGVELFMSRHASLYVDYRLRFVRFGLPEAGSEPVTVPGSSFIPGLSGLNISHKGSMWSSGMAFYF
jgi:hypothetical protein